MAELPTEPTLPPFPGSTRRVAAWLLVVAVARVVALAGLFPARLPAAPWVAALLLIALRELPALFLRPRTLAGIAGAELGVLLATVLALQASHALFEVVPGTAARSSTTAAALRGMATIAAVVLLVELLPIAPLPGALLLSSRLRRRHPAAIASRLFRRFASTALALGAMLALASRAVRSDLLAAGAVAALALLSLLAMKQERASASVAAADQAPRAGVRRSSSNPSSSTRSSSPTDSV